MHRNDFEKKSEFGNKNAVFMQLTAFQKRLFKNYFMEEEKWIRDTLVILVDSMCQSH